ncbi:GHKL domain-containing protein [Reinekea forsetii]|nr:GHKL domain-containing protein [Reinekea forsetii]
MANWQQKTLHPNIKMIAFLVISFFVLIGLLLFANKQFYALEMASIQEKASQRLSVYQNALQASIQRFEYLPAVLANDPRIQKALLSASADTTTSSLLSNINNRSGADEIFVLDSAGTTIGASNYLTKTSFVGQNYSFRPYYQSAAKGEQGFYFAVGATTGKAGLFFAEPVIVDLEIIGSVVVKINFDALEANWSQSGEKIWISDERDIIFLSYDSRWLYQGLRPLSLQESQHLVETKQYGDHEIGTLKSQQRNDGTAIVSLPITGNQVLFRQKMPGVNWHINWLYATQQIETAVARSVYSIVFAYLILIIAILWIRERVKNAQSQAKLATLIAQRESHQRAIIEGTDAGLINLTHDGKTTFVNPQAQRLFRLKTNALPDIKQLIKGWRGVHASLEAIDATGIRSDGSTFPILVSSSAIGLSDPSDYLITIHDVSELKQAQYELVKNNDELEQRVHDRTNELRAAEKELSHSQRLASLGRMSSAIAHEINQPITALSSYAASSELLIQRNQPDKVLSNLKKISGLIDRLSYISRQLRMVSGKRNTGLSNIKLLPAIHYAQDVLASKLAHAKVDLIINVDEQLCARGNSMMLEQVLVNLLSNAIDAVAKVNHPQITIKGSYSDSVLLVVEDNGIGLSQEELPHIFEPFYSAKQIDEGLGLGLAISYSLVSDMGGQLTVDSQVESGTQFTIKLTR